MITPARVNIGMGTICFIHGLNASKSSFAYLSKGIGGDPKINYTSHQPLEKSVLQVSKMLPKNEPLILVGHSLGGIIAATIALNETHDVRKVVSISTPFGGSKFAYWARWLISGLPVLNDLTPVSPAISRFVHEKIPCPMLSVISTGGALPWSTEPNDTIVTVASQIALKYGKKIEVKANHFEVLMHEKTVEVIQKFVQQEN